VDDLRVGLAQYFDFYNAQRVHQGLGYSTPDTVYQTGEGGGACTVDKWPKPAPVGDQHDEYLKPIET
jgi:putative transposase